ncbi:MAG: nucleoside monophosphate kinase [Akkermansiaceae bacterium]|nr:nucleoside monophosphate kinase [Armatimonadota bacterium]
MASPNDSLLVEQEPQSVTAKYRTILLFGAPGAGKGTVGKALGVIPGFLHMACGDVFRNMDLSTPLGRRFIEFSSKGLLVPDDSTIALWKVNIDGLVGTHTFRPDRDILVLDGIPRNVEQAKIMSHYITVERVFYLVCSDEALMIERLQRRAMKENRLDDASEEVIRRRWRVYEEETEPVLRYYPSEVIERVDAVGPPVKVIHDVLGRVITASLT